MNDQNRFKESLAALGLVFGTEITAPVARIYWSALSEFSDSQVAVAIDRAAKTLRFFPKPVEIIDLIVGNPSGAAHDAWAIVMLDLRDSAGNHKSSPEVSRIVDMLGGFRSLGAKDLRSLEFVKKEFLDLFIAQVDAGGIDRIANDKQQELGHGQ